MATITDPISLNANNLSYVIGTDTLLDVDGQAAILWDGQADNVEVTLTNFGQISTLSTFALMPASTPITGDLTFDNMASGTVHGAMIFEDLTDTAHVAINNAGRIYGNGSMALILSTAGATFAITNSAEGTIYGIASASNTQIDNSGQILSSASSAASAMMMLRSSATVNLDNGTDNTIVNHAGGVISGDSAAIRGQDVGQRIDNAAGATISAIAGAAIVLGAATTSTGHATIDNEGTIVGVGVGSKAIKAIAAASALPAQIVIGAIGVNGIADIINAGLIACTASAHIGDGTDLATIATSGGTIVNHGVIHSPSVGIEVFLAQNESNTQKAAGVDTATAITATHIKNDGIIEGGGGLAIAIHGLEKDTLFNSGHIIGDVSMDGGNDRVLLKGSSKVAGDILLGDGNDRFRGAAAAEDVYGGLGADILAGGGGKDTFHFTAITDSRTKASGRDTILDFTHKQDRIDLSAIDAVADTKADDHFTFIGKAAFGHHAGELRFHTTHGATIISGDVDGDGKADFAIHLADAVNLSEADFAL